MPATHVSIGVTVGNGPPAVFGHVVTTGPDVPGVHEALGTAVLDNVWSVQVTLMNGDVVPGSFVQAATVSVTASIDLAHVVVMYVPSVVVVVPGVHASDGVAEKFVAGG